MGVGCVGISGIRIRISRTAPASASAALEREASSASASISARLRIRVSLRGKDNDKCKCKWGGRAPEGVRMKVYARMTPTRVTVWEGGQGDVRGDVWGDARGCPERR